MLQPPNLFKTSSGRDRYLAAYTEALRLWPLPYESLFVSTPYGDTHVISSGKKDGKPLLLLHAGYASSTMWFANAADLGKSFHLVAVDTVGEPGMSVPTRQNADRVILADWLVSLLRELAIPTVDVMGLSRGAWLALNLAMCAPERVQKIVLLSPAASFIELNVFFSAVAGAVMKLPTRFVSRMALRSWVTSTFEVNPLFAEQFMVGLENWNWAVNKAGYSGVMPFAFTVDELRKVMAPVLLLIGNHDRLNPPRVVEIAKQRLRHVEAAIVPNAGHFLSMEQAGTVDRRVLEFL
jgi:pimeloyl-ACP methyl ester carboxylesterase